MDWTITAIGAIAIGVSVGIFKLITTSYKKLGKQEAINEVHESASKRDSLADIIKNKAIPTGKKLLDSIRERSGL